MSTLQTRELLELARRYHQGLSEIYAEEEEHEHSEKVQILLDYLSRHERHLERILSKVAVEVREEVLSRWFQCTPGDSPLHELEHVEFTPELTAEELAGRALRLDGKILVWYRHMADRSVAAHVREVFEELLEMEKSEHIQLARDTLELNDL